ncbi:MAG TPA: GNAT family N-acetyltransferase [Devosiaceae bacterium]|nr:GNAT family N-acetyltransferase [Devosiaceae bacterium]
MSARIIDQLDDDPEIAAWVADSLREGQRRGFFSLRCELSGAESCAVIGVDGTETAGFATFWHPRVGHDFVWIDLLWVEPPFRRRGIGTALIKAVLQAHAAPFRIGFGSLVGNAPMHALAASMGFAPWATQFEAEVPA